MSASFVSLNLAFVACTAIEPAWHTFITPSDEVRHGREHVLLLPEANDNKVIGTLLLILTVIIVFILGLLLEMLGTATAEA